MNITFIGHAVLLVEVGGIKIISDPWWIGPCFGVQWWLWPRPRLDAIENLRPDFIYISHGHNDHLHPGTLQRLSKSAKMVVGRSSLVAETLARLGFEVIILESEEQREIAAGVTIEIVSTHATDTIMIISDGAETCINANDALHTVLPHKQDQVISHVLQRYRNITYLYLGYGVASHFPNCYIIPGKDNVASAAKRQRYFNGIWSSLVARLSPRFAFPFAADVVLLEEHLIWSNEPVHNVERPTDRFRREHPQSTTIVYDIAPGFTVTDGRVTKEARFQPVSIDELRAEMADEIHTANEATPPTDTQTAGLADLIRRNAVLCAQYLADCDRDYKILVVLKGGTSGISIRKTGTHVAVELTGASIDRGEYDLVFTTRFAYLRRALATPWGHEIIFVGSGGKWEYRTYEAAAAQLHNELAVLMRMLQTPPRSRFGDQARWLYGLKMWVKRSLGIPTKDIYDLLEWTVLDASSHQ